MRRTETRPDGSGTLVFSTIWEKNSEGDEVRSELGFHKIPQVEMVEGSIRQMIARAG